MNAPDAEAAYASLREALRAARPAQLVGIHSGGVWVARRLQAELGLTTPLGSLSSAFHRDDYDRRKLPAEIHASELPFEVSGADIILVDDILYTGRTVRAALNEIFDYGRPARVRLAVLIDRGGRELPIEADFCGIRQPLPAEHEYVLSQRLDHRFELTVE
jgi:pyrimidine operon attenuation protein/uracil phosphoribosyltransferase